MKEFVLIFRREAAPSADQLSPEEMQAMTKQWQDWIGGIAAQNKLGSTGNRLSFEEGKVVRSGKVTNGPYAELKETIGGFIVVKTADIDEAVTLSQGCPILKVGGSVEVRLIA